MLNWSKDKRSPERPLPIYRLLAVFALLQGAFWLAVYPNFVAPQSEPVPFIEQTEFQYGRLAEPDALGLASAEFSDAMPERVWRERGYHAARATFTIDTVPPEGLALLGMAVGDNVIHFVNGELVVGRGAMDLEKPSYRGNLREIERIPASALNPGVNTVTAVSAIGVPREALIAPPMLADYEAASSALDWRAFLQSDMHLLFVSATLVLALLVGAVAWRSSNRALSFWLFALIASWAVYSLLPIWISFPFGPSVRIWGLFVSYCVFAIAWPVFVDTWSNKPLPYFRLLIVVAGLIVVTVGTALAAFAPARTASIFEDEAMNIIGIASVGATFVRLAVHFATTPSENRNWEGGVMLMLLFLSGWHIVNIVFFEDNAYVLSRSQPFLIVALVIGFFARRFHLFRSEQQINDALRTKVALREAELESAHSREKILVREQAFNDERQRIMRDMHDGLGSQLMGMLLAARRGKADPDSVAEGLQQVIDELRLMIDSMDSVGDSLNTALAGFRTRLQPKVEDAGFSFEWDNRLAGDTPSYPPRKTLQLFRIIQEAVTNSLKHSGGDRIRIVLARETEEGGDWLEVLVEDNGSGIVKGRAGGHGLDNMQVRAKREGGNLQINAAEGGKGTQVRILLPARSNAQAEPAGTAEST